MELGLKESSSPEAQQTLPRQAVSPGSSWCISTMDRDGVWELRSESRGMDESVNTSTPVKL